MKILPYIRFLLAVFLIIVFATNVTNQSGDGVIETSYMLFNLITGLLLFIFLVYLIVQGYYELRARIWKANALRYYALVCEFFIAADSVFIFLFYREAKFPELALALFGLILALYTIVHEVRIVRSK